MTWLLDIFMGMLGIATWQKKGNQAYPKVFTVRKKVASPKKMHTTRQAAPYHKPISRSARKPLAISERPGR